MAVIQWVVVSIPAPSVSEIGVVPAGRRSSLGDYTHDDGLIVIRWAFRALSPGRQPRARTLSLGYTETLWISPSLLPSSPILIYFLLLLSTPLLYLVPSCLFHFYNSFAQILSLNLIPLWLFLLLPHLLIQTFLPLSIRYSFDPLSFLLPFL